MAFTFPKPKTLITRIIVGVITSLIISFIYTNIAKATSIYDDVLTSHESISMIRSGCPTYEINNSTDLLEYLTTAGYSDISTVEDILDGTVSGYLLVEYNHETSIALAYPSSYPKSSAITWADPNLTLNITGGGTQYRRTINYNGSSCGFTQSNTTGAESFDEVFRAYGNITLNYPTDYEGDLFITTDDPPEVDYTNSVITTEELITSRPTGAIECADQSIDLTTDWYNKIISSSEVPDLPKQDLINIVNNPNLGWFTGISDFNNSPNYNVQIIWSTDTDSYIQYLENSTRIYTPSEQSHKVIFRIDGECTYSDIDVIYTEYDITPYHNISFYNPGFSQLHNAFITGTYINELPEDYNGTELITTSTYQTTDPDNQNHFENYGWYIDIIDKNIRFTNTTPFLYNGECTQKFTTLFTIKNDSDETIYTQPTPTNFPEWTADEYGTYTATLTLVDNSDNCDEPHPSTTDPPWIFTFTLDGSNKSFALIEGDLCSNDGSQTCTDTQPVENCSSYDWVTEYPAFLECHIKNFFINTKNFITSLFIPSPNFLSSQINDLKNHALINNNFLTYGVLWFGELPSQIEAESIQCVITTGEIFQATTNIDMCYMETKFPALWDMALSLIRITFVIMFIYATYIAYQRIWSVKA